MQKNEQAIADSYYDQLVHGERLRGTQQRLQVHKAKEVRSTSSPETQEDTEAPRGK